MTKIKTFIFNDFSTNCYILYDASYEAVIIDGAANSHSEFKQINDFLNENHLIPKYIINTHGHIDHVCGNYYLESHFRIPILMHNEDDFFIENALQLAKQFGYALEQPPKADKYVKDHEIIRFGDTELEVICIPGHTPGSIALYNAEDNFVITGDALFLESIGRTDLPLGNYEHLMNSITKRLFTLPDKTVVFPGHGPDTTIGDEKKYNPFFS
ncbi:MAG: MBL fold metallo-hydrolase [Bacteroidales bacterium]|jgi:glyoxylase-like metal-dependent hydrolase (beta-lactamase superfamily II)|nr:MBL fold metallo-hydrolase [Bacteroidales bacterium]MDD4217386.1 MBL fold metallo-hydrolase [Bacteroidales bacterium]MDY0141099.1 MBL fold metallo-hydrolase [Bacteroidales bacterium]